MQREETILSSWRLSSAAAETVPIADRTASSVKVEKCIFMERASILGEGVCYVECGEEEILRKEVSVVDDFLLVGI